jgi:hypothetical protein
MKVEYIDQEIILDVDDFDYDLFDFDKKEDGQVLGHYHGEYVAIDLDDKVIEVPDVFIYGLILIFLIIIFTISNAKK